MRPRKRSDEERARDHEGTEQTVAGDNDREREETARDEETGEAPEGAEGGDEAQASAQPDPNVARNRAERRAQAKAARRGRVAKLADDSLTQTTGEVEEDPDALSAPTTSIGGGTTALHDAAEAKRPKVPPRTMSKGTGNAEGVPEWALDAGNWFAKNRQQVVTVIAGTALLVGGFMGFRAWSGAREARATGAYNEGLTAMFAAVTPEEPGADDPRRNQPHYRTEADRSRATLEKLRAAEQRHGSARVAPLVRLSEASMLYNQGRYAEAKNLYQAVLGADLSGLEPRALEGLAFTLESLNDLDGAMNRYRELQSVQDGAFRDQAQFYQARLIVRRNDNARAKELLRGVIERTSRPAAADPTAAQQGALREQSLAILRELDPADPLVVQADRQREAGGGDSHGGHGAGADPMRGLPPELREQLQKMLRERGGGGAPPGGR